MPTFTFPMTIPKFDNARIQRNNPQYNQCLDISKSQFSLKCTGLYDYSNVLCDILEDTPTRTTLTKNSKFHGREATYNIMAILCNSLL